MLQHDAARHVHGMINSNKIGKHKLIGKTVIIIKGEMKGLRGRVTHVNGNMADLEIASRKRKVNISIDDITKVKEELMKGA